MQAGDGHPSTGLTGLRRGAWTIATEPAIGTHEDSEMWARVLHL